MLGYKEEDVSDMLYGVSNALLLINADENPAIHRYLSNTQDLLEGLLAEGNI